jgi:hypothetical protein
MNDAPKIKIYECLDALKMNTHFPRIRESLFGMLKEQVGDRVCSMDQFGSITYLNKALLFKSIGIVPKVKTEQEARQVAGELITQWNKRIATNPYFVKVGFPEFIPKSRLTLMPKVSQTMNPTNKKFDHYVVFFTFSVPASGAASSGLTSTGSSRVYDATMEIRLNGEGSLVGLYYNWHPIAGALTTEKYSIFFQENARGSGAAPDPDAESAQLVYRYSHERGLLLPYYLGFVGLDSFFIPASKYSDHSTLDTASSPLSIASDQWIKSDYNEILTRVSQFELAVALSDFDPRKVEGWVDFKKGGQYYDPSKWYNYKAYEQPTFNLSTVHLLEPIEGYVFYRTRAGERLFELVEGHTRNGRKYFPEANLIRQMLNEVGSYLDLKNSSMGLNWYGNFDFAYDGSKCVILVRVKFEYMFGVTKNQGLLIKKRVFESIAKFWTASGYGLVRLSGNNREFLPIYVYCQEVNDNASHKIIKVFPSIHRENVGSIEIQIDQFSTEKTIAHEFGHVFGLADEYEETEDTLEVYFYSSNDSRYYSDKAALMNSGLELRDRYFEHYLEAVRTFDVSSTYAIGRLSP